MIGFFAADCVLLALALAAIAIGCDQFDKGTLGSAFSTPVEDPPGGSLFSIK